MDIFLPQLEDFFHKRLHNRDLVDIMPNVLSNALKVRVSVLQAQVTLSGSSKVDKAPGQKLSSHHNVETLLLHNICPPDPIGIHLFLLRSGEHFDALVPLSQRPTSLGQPAASTDDDNWEQLIGALGGIRITKRQEAHAAHRESSTGPHDATEGLESDRRPESECPEAPNGGPAVLSRPVSMDCTQTCESASKAHEASMERMKASRSPQVGSDGPVSANTTQTRESTTKPLQASTQTHNRGQCSLCLSWPLINKNGKLRQHNDANKKRCNGKEAVATRLINAGQPQQSDRSNTSRSRESPSTLVEEHVGEPPTASLDSSSTDRTGQCSHRTKKTGCIQCPQGTEQIAASTYAEDSDSSDLSSNPILEAVKPIRTRMLKSIPKASRIQAAEAYSTLLEDILADPSDVTMWTRLFVFPFQCLAVPKRGGKHQKQTLASKINRNIREFLEGKEASAERDSPSGKERESKPQEERLRSLISEKINCGDVKGAMRLAMSSDTVAPYTEATITALRSKHPPRPPDAQAAPPPTPAASCIQFSSQQISEALSSFCNNSAGGLDGLLPQHLKDMTSACTGEQGKRLLEQLTSLVNYLAVHEVQQRVRQFFFGARLIGLAKKDGGIRPIAVGNAIRRLFGKVTCMAIKDRAASLFDPHQLGFGKARGAEGAVHATRRFLTSDSDSDKRELFLKLDFKNAFNSIRRDVMLAEVKQHFPEIFNLIHAAYGGSSILLYRDEVLASEEGIQQGDPDGPFLFCLVVLPLLLKLKSHLNSWYLDDGTVGGTAADVLADYQYVEREGHRFGLHLNVHKCELSILASSADHSILQQFGNTTRVDPSKLTLLGAPIGSEQAVDDCLTSKAVGFSRMCQRLELMDAHDAIYLLRFCIAAPKLTYVLRCSPCFRSPCLGNYDNILRDCAQRVLNVDLTDHAWLQATLPVRHGGLGIRTASDLALPAFLSSLHGTTDIVGGLLGGKFQSTVERAMTLDATATWKSKSGKELPISAAQRSWDEPIVLRRREALLDSTDNGSTSRTRLLAAAAPKAGAWLHALPVSSLGLRLTDEQVRIAAALRIGADICSPHRCTRCGEKVDKTGVHGLHCKRSAARHARHSEVNDIICRSLNSAQVPSYREPPGISRKDGKRPDGITRIPWKEGRCLLWDYTCPDTLAPSHLRGSARSAGYAANEAESKKTRKYSELASQYYFVPVGIETYGPIGREGLSFLKELGRRLELATLDKRQPAFLFQRLSVAIQRCNAACILGTLPAGKRLEDIYWSVFSGKPTMKL